MKKFIQLTLKDDCSIYIAISKIQSFTLCKDDVRFVSVMIDGNLTFNVKENVPTILQMIGE